MIDLYQYLFKNYITYDSLFALNKKAFYERSDAESVDIFIDMPSLINDIFTMPFEFSYNSTSVLTSSIINLCAHLRNYYFTRHRVWARFYIIWAWNRPDYIRQMIPEYNAHLIMAQDSRNIFKVMVEENLKILETLCPYLPDIYFFNGGNHEVGTVISTLIQMLGKLNINSNIPNIIYTRDAYQYLLVSSLPLTFIFRPKKTKGVDNSYIVSKTNLIDAYLQRELKQVSHNKPVEYNMFMHYIAYAGMKCRGVNGVIRFKQAIDYITNQKPLFFSNQEQDRVNLLYNTFNLKNQLLIFSNSAEYVLLGKGLINLINPEEVKKINDIYFAAYPLDLNVL